MEIADNIMVILYWALSLFWIVTVSISISYLLIKSNLRKNKTSRFFLTALIILGIILMSDSIYWSIATTARVGFLNQKVSDFFYDSLMVVGIKTLFLMAGVTFLYILIRSFKQIDFQIERLYFTQFVEQSVDAIGVLDTHGKVVYWNSGAEKLYGHKRHNTLGKHIKDFLVPKNLHSEIDKVLMKLAHQTNDNNYEPQRFLAPRLRKDKSEIMVDITITPFKNGEDFGGFFGVMRPFFDAVDLQLKKTDLTPLTEQEDVPLMDTQNESIYSKIASTLETQQKEFNNKRKYAYTFSIFLLLIMSISLVLTIFSEDHYKYIFGSSSFLSLIGGFWPVKYLIQNSTETFKMKAIKEILEHENIDKSTLDEALELVENINRRIN